MRLVLARWSLNRRLSSLAGFMLLRFVLDAQFEALETAKNSLLRVLLYSSSSFQPCAEALMALTAASLKVVLALLAALVLEMVVQEVA